MISKYLSLSFADSMVKEVSLEILEQQLQFLLDGKPIREGPVDICENGTTIINLLRADNKMFLHFV